MNRLITLLLLTNALAWVGCGRKTEPGADGSAGSARGGPPGSESDAAPATAGSAGGPQASTRPAGAVAPQGISGVVDPFLTTQLRLFVQQRGRMPESFAEFAGARLDSTPRLQPGLAFALDPVTQEVKIVRQ